MAAPNRDHQPNSHSTNDSAPDAVERAFAALLAAQADPGPLLARVKMRAANTATDEALDAAAAEAAVAAFAKLIAAATDPREQADLFRQARVAASQAPASAEAYEARMAAAESAVREAAEAQAIERERNNRNARSIVDREVAEAELRLPPERESYTLASWMSDPREAKVERVESLQRAGHRTLLVASYKTGKTTLHANLTRSLTEGSNFLGQFAVKATPGRVGVWNAEMDADDYETYCRDAGVTRTARVAVWNLRGYRVPLTADVAAERAVAWLRDNEVSYWIIDPWARICSWSGTDENVNAEVGPLLQRLDEIANDAGVEEVLVVHHAGHVRGRPRGATVLPDWADGIWTYDRDEEDKRYLRAEGRGVGIAEGLVEIGDDGRTVYRQVGRKGARTNALAREIVDYVKANPGCPTMDAKNALEGGHAAADVAMKKALAAAYITVSRYWVLFHVAA